MKAELVDVAAGPRTFLGESPRWDGTAWWWVDVTAGHVWRRQPGMSASPVWQTGERTSLVHPEAVGRVVVARREQLYLLSPQEDGTWHSTGLWCDLGLGAGWMVNDGVADARGRLWIGAIAPDRAPLDGVLLQVDRDGTVSVAAEGFTMSNGMGWDAEGKRLYHVDTSERVIWTHRVDIESGEVLGREPFVDFLESDGLPDGLTTDVVGGVWVAIYGAGQVRRFDTDGNLDIVVEVNAEQCTSVQLGGPDGHDLLITTAREGYDAERSARDRTAGRLFRARSEHRGVPVPPVVVDEGSGR